MSDFDKYRNRLQYPNGLVREALMKPHRERIDNTPLTAKERYNAEAEARKLVDVELKKISDAYRAENARLTAMFWADFDIEHGTGILPDDVRVGLQEHVHDEWHSSGLADLDCGSDLVKLVLAAFNAGKEAK